MVESNSFWIVFFFTQRTLSPVLQYWKHCKKMLSFTLFVFLFVVWSLKNSTWWVNMGVSVAAVLLLLEKVMLAITADVRPAHNYVVTMLIICTKVQQQKKKKIQKNPLAKERNRKIQLHLSYLLLSSYLQSLFCGNFLQFNHMWCT